MSLPDEEEIHLEDSTPLSIFRNLNISKGGRNGKSDECPPGHVIIRTCGHAIPPDYLIAWCKYCLKQKKTDFTCPRFDKDGKKTCGMGFSYQDLCQSATLTPEQKEDFEERLGALTAAKLCDYKPCPGCQSYVERANKTNLCVRCIICTAKMGHTYEFCWNCRKPWKGSVVTALKCENKGCGERAHDSPPDPQASPPDPLVLCNPEFKKNKLEKKKDDIYTIIDKSTTRKRLALLVNNIQFQFLNDRVGAEKDELDMEKLFAGLGYTVVTLRDLSAQGMDAAMQDFSKREEHKQSDSCFVVFMSHGNASGLCGVSDRNDKEKDIFNTDKIFEHLYTQNCAGLRDKPKIILIQSCRGDAAGAVNVQDSAGHHTEHQEKDICCLRSCTLDTVSYRNPEKGTDFFQDIVEIFNQNAHQDHIEELFRKVLLKFKKSHPSQMPCKERTSLSKKFYLFPGL